MFTLLRNYKTMLSCLVMHSFGNKGEAAASSADTNNDGILTGKEFNELSASDKRKVQNYLKKEGKLDQFIAEKQIKYKEKVQAQSKVTQAARVDQQKHKLRVEDVIGARRDGTPIFKSQTSTAAESSDTPSAGIPKFEKKTFTRTLQKGTKGSDVQALQKFLTNAGFDARYKGKFDGDFGGGTRKALMAYQRANNLPVSGKLSASKTGSSKTLNHMLGVSPTQEVSAQQGKVHKDLFDGSTVKGSDGVTRFVEQGSVKTERQTAREARRAKRQAARTERQQARQAAREARAEKKTVKTSAAESKEVSASSINYPPKTRNEAITLQKLIYSQASEGGQVDGKFGGGSRKQLQRFLQAKGLYTGAIDGNIGRGSRAAIKQYNSKTQTVSQVAASVPKRNVFQRIGDFIKKGGTRPTSLKGIDAHLDAKKNPELRGLEQKIATATSNANAAGIDAAHREAVQALKGKIPDDMHKALAGASTTVEKNRALDFVANSLMGGNKSVDIAQGRLSAREYGNNLQALIPGTKDVLRSEGFSSSFIANMEGTAAQMKASIAKAKTFKALYGKKSDAYFSVRDKGSNSQLQPFAKGTTEQLVIDGKGLWSIPVNDQDVTAFIDNMSPAQLSGISKGLTKVELKKLIASGDVQVTGVSMMLAHNCGNVGFSLDLKGKKIDASGGNGGGGEAGGVTAESNPGSANPGDVADVGEVF